MTINDLSPIQILVISHKTGGVLYNVPLTKITSAKFNKKQNDVGKVVFTFIYDEDIINTLELDNFIEVYIYNKSTEQYEKFETYLIRITNQYEETDIKYYTVAGISLDHLIMRRVLDTSVDPNTLNGWVTLYGTAHSIMTDLANNHFINCSNTSRNFPLMTINEIKANVIAAAIRKRYENLYPLFQEVAEKGNTAFSVRRTTGRNLELVLGKLGDDKTYKTNYPNNPCTILSPNFGNLLNPSIEVLREGEKNFCYVLGEGDDDSQIVLQFATSATNDSFYNRIEFITLQRNGNSQYLDIEALLTKGVEELRGGQKKINFSYDFNINDKTLSLELGDEITVAWNTFVDDIEITFIEGDLSNNVFKIKYEARLNEV